MELLALQSTHKCSVCEAEENRLCFSTPHLAAAVKGESTQSARKNFLTQVACITVLATAALFHPQA